MRPEKISRGVYAILLGVAAFTVSFFMTANAAYAVDFSTSFSPAADVIEQDADTTITISFDRAVYADATGTVFTDTTLQNVVSLHTINADGKTIPFTASISADNMEIAVDPTNTLSDGAVYVAMSDAYYDGDGLQGDAASTIFFVAAAPPADTTAPTVTFSPASGATIDDARADVVLTFSEAVYMDASQTVFDATALAGLVMLKSTDVDGADIPFTASISADNMEITVDPTDDLAIGTVYVAISDGYYDDAQNQGDATTNTFTVEAPAPPADTTAPTVTFSPASGATIDDARADVVLTFSEAVYMDASQTVFDATALAGLVMLKSTDVDGADIPFTASISADNMEITVDPTDDLAIGTVYVAISDGYYDDAQNQGDATTNTFTVEAPAPPADTTAPTVTFSPASGATIDDARADVVLTFSEAVYMDASQTVFDATALAGLVMLKSTDVDGADIPFTASISADNMEITVDPTDDLAIGTVYVAISDGYYDDAQNQGDATTNTFTVEAPAPPADTTAPTVTFSPASGATIDDARADVVLTFSEAVYMDASQTVFDATALAGLVMLKSTDVDGADIPFTASISADNMEITVDPTDDLAIGTVYVAISDGYYDDAQNQGDATTNTFTVEAPTGFTVTSTPESGEVITDNTANISLTFNQAAYRNSNQAVFTTNDLASFVVLRTDDVYGYGIPFEASMSADNMTITIDPADTLKDGAVYVAISEDYYNADKTRGVAFNATFSVDTGTPAPIDDIFSYLLNSSPAALLTAPGIANTASPSIETSEEFREMQIQEALSLLQQALELLAIVAVIDNTSPTAPTLPVQDVPAETGETGDTAQDDTSEDSPSINTLLSNTNSGDIAPTVDTSSSDVSPTGTSSDDAPEAVVVE